MTRCTLCDLETPDPPVTDEDVEGTFCCRGCLEVARTMDDAAAADAETAREAVDTGPDAESVDGEEAFLAVEGMHCATCEAFVESVSTDEEGVLAADASYPAGSLKVTYDPDEIDRDALPGLVDGMGYSAADMDEGGPEVGGDAPGSDSVGRLLVGGFFGMMLMVMYVLFLYPAYLGLPRRYLLAELDGFAGGYLLWNVWVMASVVLFYTGYPLLRGAYVSLRVQRPNMDLLIGLAAGTAYLYSTLGLLVGRVDVYFDVSVVIVLAVTLGNYYEGRIKDRAAGALADLTAERVDEARRRTGEGTETVELDDLAPGDEVVVKPGERVPIDGTVVDGSAAVDQSLVTGESRPVPAEPGDEVVGGAVATDGALVVEVGEDATSTLDRLVEYLWNVRSTDSGAQRLADKIAAVFVPTVIVLAVVAGVVHLALGSAPTDALLTALAVLVVSCPCALGLATPLAVAAGVREALDRGIVVTDGTVFETAAESDVVALDKTGTLTEGRMELARVETDGDADRAAVLSRAAAVESFADHPLAVAVTDAAGSDGWALDPPTATDFERHPGRGVSADVDGDRAVVGRPDLLADRGLVVPDGVRTAYDAADADGDVPALVGWGGRARGVVVGADTPRREWRSVVADLAEDRRVVVITGDRGGAADRFRDHPGIDEVFAGVPPEAKAEVVDRLRSEGTVTMVGDGSNDAPALAKADLGIAFESGTKLAADAADAVVTTGDLRSIPEVFDVTTGTRSRIRQNLGWAFLYNAIAVPLAVLGLINPLFAAVAMATSSLLVVGNSTRRLGGESAVEPRTPANRDDGSAGSASADPQATTAG